jgi:ammonium transporter, Amt family
VAASGIAGMAMAVTQIATATAALSWMFIEWLWHGKPSVLGIATGAVAGLVAITPASGTAGPVGALVIGASAGAGSFPATTLGDLGDFWLCAWLSAGRPDGAGG